MYRLSHPSGTTHAQHHKYWECASCNHRYNPVDIASCLICDNDRTKSRYCIAFQGSIYLCRLLKNNSTLKVLNVLTDDHFETNLTKTDESVEEGIMDAIDRHIARASTIDSTMGKKKPIQPAASINLSSSASALGTSLSLLLNPGLSLFDGVISNAESVVYSSKIGQYVSKETVSVDDTSDSPSDYSVKFDFSYVSAMNQERHVMNDVVGEVVRRRNEAYLYDSSADLDVNRSEWEPYQDCQLCERSYPKSQLYGLISMKAVINWKMEHNVQFAPNDHRLDISSIHNGAKLCIFCTQFFDSQYADLFDPQQMKLSVGIGDLHGPLNCSNTVYKKMLRTTVKKWQLFEQVRPLSRMRHKIELEQLRLKAIQSDTNNRKARFQFNPKLPDRVVDQEQVGYFLRQKYAESKHGLLLAPKKAKKKVRRLDPIAMPVSIGSNRSLALDHSVEADKVVSKARRKSLNDKGSATMSNPTVSAVKHVGTLAPLLSTKTPECTPAGFDTQPPVPSSVPYHTSSLLKAKTSKHTTRTRQRLTLQVKRPVGETTSDGRVIEIELSSDSIKAALPKLKLHELLDNIRLHRLQENHIMQKEEVGSVLLENISDNRGKIEHEFEALDDSCDYEDDFVEDEVDVDSAIDQGRNNETVMVNGWKDSVDITDTSDDKMMDNQFSELTSTDVSSYIPDNERAKHVVVPPLTISEEINCKSDTPNDDDEYRGRQTVIPQTEEEYVDDFSEEEDLFDDDGDNYYYDDDDFGSDEEEIEPDQNWGLAESMDEYNWVTGGAFVPPASAIDSAPIIEGISPNNVVYEASLPSKTVDRIELLSRGSSSGFTFRPTSTGNASRESRYRKYMGSEHRIAGESLSPLGHHNILVNAWEISSPTHNPSDRITGELMSTHTRQRQNADKNNHQVSDTTVQNANRKLFAKTKKLKTKYSTGLKPTWKT